MDTAVIAAAAIDQCRGYDNVSVGVHQPGYVLANGGRLFIVCYHDVNVAHAGIAGGIGSDVNVLVLARGESGPASQTGSELNHYPVAIIGGRRDVVGYYCRALPGIGRHKDVRPRALGKRVIDYVDGLGTIVRMAGAIGNREYDGIGARAN